jgi:hypothetical protein
MEHQQGRPPSEDELFYIAWARESLKNNINLCNDILKQTISIGSALLGMTLIFDKVISESWKIPVIFVSIVSLIVAFAGVFPFRSEVHIDNPEEIKIHKEKTLKRKRIYLIVSAGFLLMGFLVIAGSLIYKLVVK